MSQLNNLTQLFWTLFKLRDYEENKVVCIFKHTFSDSIVYACTLINIRAPRNHVCMVSMGFDHRAFDHCAYMY